MAPRLTTAETQNGEGREFISLSRLVARLLYSNCVSLLSLEIIGACHSGAAMSRRSLCVRYKGNGEESRPGMEEGGGG